MYNKSIKHIIISIFYYICANLGKITGMIHGKCINYYNDYKTIGESGITKFTDSYKNSINLKNT